MPELNDILLHRIRAIMPELAVDHFEVDQEGLINQVVIVNRQLVFRFARNEQAARILETELKILDLVRPRLGVHVPTPIYRSPDCMVYPFLNGKTLSRKLVLAAEESTQGAIAEQLGVFLYKMHTTNVSDAGWQIPLTRAPVRQKDWLDIQTRLKKKVYPLLQKYQIEWLDDLLGNALETPGFFEYPLSLIHGDLASYHILYDPQEQKINAVIDFGMAGLGDAASDVGGLINIYGESFVTKIHQSYPGLENILPRARFYAQSLELQWVLLGLETGEDFWFTAHIGGARDIYS